DSYSLYLAESTKLSAPASAHRGGANVLMGDGAVRFESYAPISGEAMPAPAGAPMPPAAAPMGAPAGTKPDMFADEDLLERETVLRGPRSAQGADLEVPGIEPARSSD